SSSPVLPNMTACSVGTYKQCGSFSSSSPFPYSLPTCYLFFFFLNSNKIVLKLPLTLFIYLSLLMKPRTPNFFSDMAILNNFFFTFLLLCV
ncbi:mCG145454, partial [Mus musculus]